MAERLLKTYMGVKYNYISQGELRLTKNVETTSCGLSIAEGIKGGVTTTFGKERIIVKMKPCNPHMQLFRENVFQKYAACKNASELALHCDYNCLKTFTRHFKEYFKQTPYQWMLERKMEEIHSLVINSEMSVSEIAKQYGFKNVTHLINSYQNKFGISPKRNRKLHNTH